MVDVSIVGVVQKDRKKLEQIILMDRFLLDQKLSQALINLKARRLDLFNISSADQIGLILKALLGR